MRAFYDEVQRIGNRIGTVKTETGQWNVATQFLDSQKFKQDSDHPDKSFADFVAGYKQSNMELLKSQITLSPSEPRNLLCFTLFEQEFRPVL